MRLETMAQRIKFARQQAKLSQAALAKRIGITRTAIYQWESGMTKQLSAENICELQRITGVNACWIVTGRGVIENIEITEEQLALLRAAAKIPNELALRVIDALSNKGGIVSLLLFLVGVCLGVIGFFMTIGLSGLGALQGGIAFLAGCVLIGAAAIVEAVENIRRIIVKALQPPVK